MNHFSSAPLVALIVTGLLWTDSGTCAQPRKKSITTKGEIKSMQPPIIEMSNKSGKKWLFKVEAQPQDIVYRGSADPRHLKPKMLVQFSARFDNKGSALEPVNDILVFSMRPGYTLGLIKEASGTFRVAGHVTKYEEGNLSVKTPRKTVEVQLAEGTMLTLDLTDYTLARPGDEIEVKGYFYQGGKGIASKLEIKSETPWEPAEQEEQEAANKELEAGNG
tara:strand:+ start:183 stop:842 length:660 start_codon:yes stop_codon:yes gene_type:complete